ncbi:hypothetical protein O8I67_09020 [Streptococcus uberis]|uniref:hypothetical protein n=1 Tax=Streptococcus uberis TaxID=1349 RepID=UPI0022B8B863|nr:hypothetical protein [Streptococcus uberis]MCZ8467198.1 hypothetical protein [Streptococcus uberis]
MTTMQSITTDIFNYGNEQITAKKSFIAYFKSQTEQFSNGRLTQIVLEENLKNKAEEIKRISDSKFEAITAVLSAFITKELDSINNIGNSVTANDVAELDLLSTMTLTQEEFISYYIKYKNKPLAVKKLQQIHRDIINKPKQVFFPMPKLKNELLIDFQNQANEALEYINKNIIAKNDFEIGLTIDKNMVDVYNKWLNEIIDEYEK